MKKFLYVVGLVTLVLFNYSNVYASGEVYYTNLYDIEMTEQEYNNLLGLGFTEQQIARMDYQTFIDNKDIEGVLISQTSKYLKTTTTIRNGIKTTSYQVFPNQQALLLDMNLHTFQQPTYSPNTSGYYYDGIIEDNYRLIMTRISNIYDTYMRYKIDIDWLTMPSVRSVDIIGIGIEPSKVGISSSIMFREDWMRPNNEFGYNTICAPKEESTGGSALFELPTGSLETLTSYLYFNVAKLDPNETIYALAAVGDYAHATETVDIDDVYDYYTVNHGVGIDIDTPYANSYESPSVNTALFGGTW